MKFSPGDQVLVVDGKYKGSYGTVLEYWIDSPIIEFGDDQPNHGVVVVSDETLEALTDEEEVLDIPVHDFGIPQDVFQRHLEYLIGRSLAHVGNVGAKEAFFGFQEFEGKTAEEVLLELMLKLEEGMAMFAQTHILIGRIVAALEDVHDQI